MNSQFDFPPHIKLCGRCGGIFSTEGPEGGWHHDSRSLCLRSSQLRRERRGGDDDTDACLKLTDETDMTYNIDYFSKFNHFTVFFGGLIIFLDMRS